MFKILMDTVSSDGIPDGVASGLDFDFLETRTIKL